LINPQEEGKTPLFLCKLLTKNQNYFEFENKKKFEIKMKLIKI